MWPNPQETSVLRHFSVNLEISVCSEALEKSGGMFYHKK